MTDLSDVPSAFWLLLGSCIVIVFSYVWFKLTEYAPAQRGVWSPRNARALLQNKENVKDEI